MISILDFVVVLDTLQTQKSNERHQFYSKKIILFTCISEFVDQKGRKDVVNVVLLSYETLTLTGNLLKM